MAETLEGQALRWKPVSLEQARAARERTREITVRTPLVRFDYDSVAEIYLKLELLQPIRAFKLRGASNAMLAAGREELAEGVWTSSAGNMAQGVAYAARALGVPAVIYMPDTAPQATRTTGNLAAGDYVVTISVTASYVSGQSKIPRCRSTPPGGGYERSASASINSAIPAGTLTMSYPVTLATPAGVAVTCGFTSPPTDVVDYDLDIQVIAVKVGSRTSAAMS